MSFWSHPAWKSFRDANPWMNHITEALWYASLPSLYALLVVYLIWKWLEPRRMTRNTLLYSKAFVPILLTSFFVTGYLYLTVNGSIRDYMAYAFTLSLHLSAFLLIASFQPFYRERLTYEASKLLTVHYVILIAAWFVMELLILFCFPPLKILLNVGREARTYLDVTTSLIILGFPAVILRTVEDAWLCFKAPYYMYRSDNKEIGLIFKKNGVWIQNVREKPVVAPKKVKKPEPASRSRPRRIRLRK